MKSPKYAVVFVLACLPVMLACQLSTQVQPTTLPVASFQPSTPDIGASQAAQMRDNAQIQLTDSGKTFTYHITDRFSVFLDDTTYPVKDLTCTPDGILGTISNGSFRGPDHYPIMFEAVAAGQCTLQDGSFSVTINVAKP